MKNEQRSGCPISTTLELIGDRWTLVLFRDMINGKTKYSEFLASPEQITTNVLADRLTKMEANGLVTKELYQERPKRYAYALTKAGADLLPVAQAMCNWANAHIPGTWIPPESFMQSRD